MSIRLVFLCIFFITSPTNFRNVDSRSIFRSGGSDSVNLVEFNIKGVIYGKCSYSEDGQDISVIFEERDGEIKAKSINPTILDPISKAELCREAASKPSTNEPQFRSGLDETEIENEHDLASRFAEFEHEMTSNHDYVEHLKPRIFSLLSAIGSNTNNYGITFGSIYNTSSLPSLGFNLPQYSASQATVGFGFPFKTSLGKK